MLTLLLLTESEQELQNLCKVSQHMGCDPIWSNEGFSAGSMTERINKK